MTIYVLTKKRETNLLLFEAFASRRDALAEAENWPKDVTITALKVRPAGSPLGHRAQGPANDDE